MEKNINEDNIKNNDGYIKKFLIISILLIIPSFIIIILYYFSDYQFIHNYYINNII